MSAAARFLAVFACLALSACATAPGGDTRRELAQGIAASNGMQPVSYQTADFKLAGFAKMQAAQQPVTIYIEGDGYAWRSKHRVSDDPTPTDPVALKLAVSDAAANVIYLARPCQYADLQQETHCDSSMWTNARLSERVVQSYMQVLDAIKAQHGVTGFHLVGYSGGGGIAVLLAERRSDILSLRTVSGLLDSDAFTNYHHVSPLDLSLNPANRAASLSGLPQMHYIGADDQIVPSVLAQNFVARMGSQNCAQIVVAPDVTHEKGWEAYWPLHAATLPACSQ